MNREIIHHETLTPDVDGIHALTRAEERGRAWVQRNFLAWPYGQVLKSRLEIPEGRKKRAQKVAFWFQKEIPDAADETPYERVTVPEQVIVDTAVRRVTAVLPADTVVADAFAAMRDGHSLEELVHRASLEAKALDELDPSLKKKPGLDKTKPSSWPLGTKLTYAGHPCYVYGSALDGGNIQRADREHFWPRDVDGLGPVTILRLLDRGIQSGLVDAVPSRRRISFDAWDILVSVEPKCTVCGKDAEYTQTLCSVACRLRRGGLR